MEVLGLLVALFFPWLLGVVWLRCCWLKDDNINWPTLLGYGYLAGVLMTTQMMRLLDAVGMRLGFLNVALTLTLLIALGIWCGRAVMWRHGLSVGTDWHGLAKWHKAAFAGLLALLVVRLSGLGLEVIWQPVFPMDAWTAWATKARVWFEFGHLAPFVPTEIWLKKSGVFTDGGPYYPPAIPLLQVWTCFGLGRWDDSLMNLPWLLCAIALSMAFYGQARQWGIAPLFAMMFTYFLLSLPMLDTHVALAGYADLFMATFYGLASFAFFHWSRSRNSWQGVVAILIGAGCVLIKRPGICWELTLLFALWVALAPRAGSIGLSILVGLGLAVLLLFDLKGFKLLEYPLEFTFTPVWSPILVNLAIFDNWHLFFYMLAAALFLSLPRLFAPAYRAMTVLVCAAWAFLLMVFFFTQASQWVATSMLVNRALLHLVPMLMFYMMVLFWENFNPQLLMITESSNKNEAEL